MAFRLIFFGVVAFVADQAVKELVKSVYGTCFAQSQAICTQVTSRWYEGSLGHAASLTIGLGVLVALAYFGLSSQQSRKAWVIGIVILLAGGISNTIDRVLFSGVRDVLHFGSLSLNLADIFILTGALLTLYSLVITEAKEEGRTT